MNCDVARLQLAEVDAGHDFPMGYEKQLVPDEKVRKVRVLAPAADDFVEQREDYGFKPRKLANFFDDRRGRDVYTGAAASEIGR